MRTRLTLGVVLPLIVAVTAGIDITWRFIPYIVDASPSQRELLFRTPGDAFLRNASSRSDFDYGDLARVGNLPALRQYRRTRFTSDAFGFRNLPSQAPVEAILFGSSFAVGAGVSDEQTLSAQLSMSSGCRVYNSAGVDTEFQLPTAARILTVAHQIGMTSGVVIIERVERLGFPAADPATAHHAESKKDPVSGSGNIREVSRALVRSVTHRPRPLRLMLQGAYNRLQNDVILPNPYASLVTKAQLVNGDWMLFYRDEMKAAEWSPQAAAMHWSKLGEELHAAGYSLVVVLVPNKYTVYRSLLAGQPLPSPQEGLLLHEVVTALRQAGVTAIDLTPALRREAELALQTHQYVYFRDDTHWNPAGIALSAGVIQHVLATQHTRCFRKTAGR